MLDDLECAFSLTAVEMTEDSALILLLLFVISALILGIPAVLKKSLKYSRYIFYPILNVIVGDILEKV